MTAYKADGTAFWDQFFLAPLCDAKENVVFFVCVHCEVNQAPLDTELQEVVKNTKIEEMEAQMGTKL